MVGWASPSLDSYFVFNQIMRSDASWNATGFRNRRVDKLLDELSAETDTLRRIQLAGKIWEIGRTELPYIPLHHQVVFWAMQSDISIPLSATDEVKLDKVYVFPI